MPNKRTPEDVVAEYPLTGLVIGWYFRVDEIEPGFFNVEGTDLDGRQVQRQSTNRDRALEAAKQDARDIRERR